MKVLILTGRFGMGHVKCAETLKEIMTSSNESLDIDEVEVEIVDMIDYLYPHFSKGIYSGFNTLVSKCSNLYNELNVIAGKHSVQPMKWLCMNRIGKLMEEQKPDQVVANLPICGQYFSLYRRMSGNTTPLYVCVTDITFHNEWIAPDTDLYFVGDVATKNALISRGVNPEIVHVTGIPVSNRFISAEHEPGLCKVLVMGGGLGLVPGGDKTLNTLAEMEGVEVTLVCGKNQKLYDSAKKKYPKFNVLGYTTEVPALMAEASVIITKPGGITTFESIKSETPMYIIAPTLEQEIGNARFIESNNIGRILYNQEDFTEEDLKGFIANEKLINQMKENMRALSGKFEPANLLLYYKEAA